MLLRTCARDKKFAPGQKEVCCPPPPHVSSQDFQTYSHVGADLCVCPAMIFATMRDIHHFNKKGNHVGLPLQRNKLWHMRNAQSQNLTFPLKQEHQYENTAHQ
jgi:hypothetical protein